MVDFIDEVNDDIQRGRWVQFWSRVGTYTVIASVAIVGATVASVAWKHYQESQQLQAAEAYLQADVLVKDAKWEEAQAAFVALQKKNAAGFSVFAYFKNAQTLQARGDIVAAEAEYEVIATSSKTEPSLKALARIYAGQMKYDRGVEYAEMEAWMKPLTDDSSAPFSPLAKELLAYAALEANDKEAARNWLRAIAADISGAPSSQQQRAQAHLDAISENPSTDESGS